MQPCTFETAPLPLVGPTIVRGLFHLLCRNTRGHWTATSATASNPSPPRRVGSPPEGRSTRFPCAITSPPMPCAPLVAGCTSLTNGPTPPLVLYFAKPSSFLTDFTPCTPRE